jgi:hypothetical protein
MEGLPTIGQPQQVPTIDEQRRSAALQLAIQSFGPSDYTDDALIKRAARVHTYLTTGAN